VENCSAPQEIASRVNKASFGDHKVVADKTQSGRGQGFYFRRLEEFLVLFGDNFTTLLLRQM
jgi:hypothetical protein